MARRPAIIGAAVLATATVIVVLCASLSTRPYADPILAPVELPSVPAASPMAELIPDATAALELLSNQLITTRQRGAERPAELVDLLLRVAELSRELGRDVDAKAFLREARDFHGSETHWQVREASRKLADLDVEAVRPEGDRAKLRQARELHRSASALYHRGQYLPALAVCEHLLTIRRELLPDAHPDLADSLCLLGQLQSNRGELYGKAFETLLLAREAFRKTIVDPENWTTSRTPLVVGSIVVRSGGDV